jgi:hypothetical protein
MKAHLLRQGFQLLIGSLMLLLPYSTHAAETTPALVVQDAGASLYPRQDAESEPIAKLAKGEALIPMVEAVGPTTWYMVKTRQGLIGWVRAADVSVSTQVKEAFKEQVGSTWSARTGDGRTFEGTWTVEPAATANAASGTWTVSEGAGKVSLRGTWSAQKFATGWSGTWRAAAEGQQGEMGGSWTADFNRPRETRFADLFAAAARDAIRGIWSAGSQSGSFALRAAK